jgi:hypothetical protein
MAACIVNITGTSGTLKLNYTLSSVQYTLETGIVPVGTLWIDSAATNVTYTTLSGDVIASPGAGCSLTITAAPPLCSLLTWDGKVTTSGYVANAIIIGSIVVPITETSWPNSGSMLVNSINNASSDAIKVIGYKNNSTTSYSYILRSIGSNVPQLRVRNADNTGFIYIPAAGMASCTVPSDYQYIVPCYGTLPTTTTTTAAPTTTTTTIAPGTCDLYTIDISDKDLSAATGNTITSYNGKVYIVYTNCSNVLITNVYTVAGLQPSICLKSGTLPSYYYYQNDIQTSGDTIVTLAGTC